MGADQLFFLDYAPVIFTSAVDGFQLDRLLEAIRYVDDQWRQRIPPLINRTLKTSSINASRPTKPANVQALLRQMQLDGSPPPLRFL